MPLITFFILLLLLSSSFMSSSKLVKASRLLDLKNEYVTLYVERPIGAPATTPYGFTSKELDACLPKHFRRRNSAPSRYVNYHTLDQTLCSNDKKKLPISTPWCYRRLLGSYEVYDDIIWNSQYRSKGNVVYILLVLILLLYKQVYLDIYDDYMNIIHFFFSFK